MRRPFVIVLGLAVGACGARTGLRDGGLDAAEVVSYDAAERLRSSDRIAVDDGGELGGLCFSAGCPASCLYCCRVEIELGQDTNCSGRINGSFSGNGFVAGVDMNGLTELDLTVALTRPSGFSVHVADSPSCNGGGGDSGQFSNDSEVQLFDGTITAFANDLDPAGPSSLLLEQAGYVAGDAICEFRTWIVSDQRFRSVTPAIDQSSPYLLRINPPTDPEGMPDAFWYIALNRTVGDSTRSGTGVANATICLR